MKKKLISENNNQKLYRIYSYEDSKTFFPNASFSSSKRALRLFLDTDSLSESLLEDFTKHLLLFDDNGTYYYIVVNIGDEVSKTNINDKGLMKVASTLMKDYSVSKLFVKFITENKEITESERINHIKRFVPHIYLDYIIDNNLKLEEWDWLPRNLIKKQLLTNPKYLSYLIKKDNEKDDCEENNKYNETSIFIIDYLLSGKITNKTLNFLKNLFKDPLVSCMFQETIDVITSISEHSSGCSITKSILHNIFTLEKESIIKINAFNSAFIGVLKNNFKDSYLDYLDILIDKKIKFIFENKDNNHFYSQQHVTALFFDTKRFEYLISHSDNLEETINSFGNELNSCLFSYCFQEERERVGYNGFGLKTPAFNDNNLTLLLKDPLRSRFVCFKRFVDLCFKYKHDKKNYNSFSNVLHKTDLSLIYSHCNDDLFFKEKIVYFYTNILQRWDGVKSYNENYLERIKSVYDFDKDNINYIRTDYLFMKDNQILNDIYDFDYNSSQVQMFFEKFYNEYIKNSNEYQKKSILNKIKNRAEDDIFIKKYDSRKWENKGLVEILDSIVDIDFNFNFDELKDLLSKGNTLDIAKYCEDNKRGISDLFKRDRENEFIKNLSIIFNSFSNR